MAEQPPESLLTMMGIASFASLATLFFLFQKHIDGRPLLAYEPRIRVPWGALVAWVAIAMPLFGAIAFLIALPDPVAEPMSDESQLAFGWGNFTFMMAFLFGIAAWIAAVYRADAFDFGLPTSGQQAVRDIGIGCLATAATLLPTYAIQLTLINALGIETKHPLVEQVEADQSAQTLILAFAMAVIAAPLFEEFTFRCLFQGWLEKCEDALLGFKATERPTPAIELSESESFEPEELIADDPTITPAEHSLDPQFDDSLSSTSPPAAGWLPILPHGWTPVLISGVAFGMAHLGHGVAWISLILFGIVLGYVYQRTHRLLPCITAHMLFNGYSMVLLWLQLNPAK